ncbi:MAG: hypothetical protein EP344_03765 [Bacteroidetes bacterium]|nr:MAG: hypothetical protein EP344_03765 [Bacteroidota bacterium]
MNLTHWWKKWTVWEYLPWWLANVPVYGIYSWFALQARHLFFFSNVNPDIPLGGAVGESKHAILELLPGHIKPKTLFVSGDMSYETVVLAMEERGLEFPVVAKPDVGERGFLVQKFAEPEDLRQHLERFKVPFLIQEFLTLPVEMTVLFHRFPDTGEFGISSVCVKEFMSITGDGQSSVRALMEQSPRSAFQVGRFEREFPDLMDQVPALGEQVLLEPIGNHSRGTKFLNGNHLIDARLEATFEQVCRQMDGVLFGRFDLKCASVEALRQGEFRVMELNGVFGEPAHVYDPANGLGRVLRDYYTHWSILYQLHRAQLRMGVRPTPYREAVQIIMHYLRYKRELDNR